MLGNILRLVRISNNMNISAASKELYLKSSLIDNIETGKVKLSLSTLEVFSEFYQVPMSQILLLNDFQEHFGVSDEKILEDIKKYYRYSKYQNQGKQKVK